MNAHVNTGQEYIHSSQYEQTINTGRLHRVCTNTITLFTFRLQSTKLKKFPGLRLSVQNNFQRLTSDSQPTTSVH